jgi:16S rRNA (cytidine1402-2'-O)-methyltransferase
MSDTSDPQPPGPSHIPALPANLRGLLTVVATPIGNLEDLSPRARRAFEEADLVACEDTRRTGRLLAHLGLKKKLVSLHEHNERARLPRLLAALERGGHIVLASDAGTPLVSDPGYLLVREAVALGLAVEPIPGPSALLAALVVSGLPPHPFTFAGFPPPKGGKRRGFYRRFAELGHTLVVYESPHRLPASLEDALAELGDRPAVLARELTKLHEEVLRGSLTEILDEVRRRPSLKGEYVLVIDLKS